jgi:hypothetical protein
MQSLMKMRDEGRSGREFAMTVVHRITEESNAPQCLTDRVERKNVALRKTCSRRVSGAAIVKNTQNSKMALARL